ncbi:Uncharacterised protein [Mycoplasmopsis maculosa]|uniref:Uncharacterized protein n=1 Tax=Mycoplasmopsis maculosa TaxID=114885 RepID=A0A449B5E7_9BACT|nr:hypothetical protein [Mycoplasmopsis maculosa]VEU75748.1 Uncharacterised protein [Mycoplasmopsis maculosa]
MKRLWISGLINNILSLLSGIIPIVLISLSAAAVAGSVAYGSGFSSEEAVATAVGIGAVGVFLWIMFSIISIAAFVVNIIITIKANDTTARILMIVGFFFGPLFSLIGCALLLKKENAN